MIRYLLVNVKAPNFYTLTLYLEKQLSSIDKWENLL